MSVLEELLEEHGPVGAEAGEWAEVTAPFDVEGAPVAAEVVEQKLELIGGETSLVDDEEIVVEPHEAVLPASLEELDRGVFAGCGGEFGDLVVGVDHDATVAIEDEVRECRMRDSFGGYDWGDPVVLWTWPRRPRFEFSVEQLAVAERVLGGAA